MTGLRNAAEVEAPRRRERARVVPGRALAAVPWLVVLVALVVAWRWSGVSGAEVAAFTGYWVLCLLLPGTLVHRALRGSRGNLPEDLGHGAVVGLLLELVAWVAAAATGQQQLLRWWPVPVVLLFLVLPRLRRHWRIAEPRPLPLGWHVATAGVVLLVFGWAVTQWSGLPMPPVEYDYYQDLLYHLSLVHELTRTMPFEVPQWAGEPLRYHYLSNAHLASASMITGIAPDVVLLRLWVVPVVATAVLVTAGLAQDVSGRNWAGPLTAVLAYVGVPVSLGSAWPDRATPLVFGSPSQVYVLPFVLLLAGLCVDLARGRGLRAGWVLLPLLGLACAGSKSSALPPLIAGLVLAGVAVAATRRRVPWPVAGAVLILAAAMAAGYRLFAGGGAGTLKVQFLAFVRFVPPYDQTLNAGMGVGGLVPPALETAGVASWLFTLGILGWWLLMEAPRLIGLLILTSRGTRVDPAAWLVAGTLVAGVAGAWIFFHPSFSQVYFFLPVIPLGVLLSVWLLAVTGPRWPVLAGVAVAGGAAKLALPMMAPPAKTQSAWAGVLAGSAARMAVFAAVAALLTVLVTMALRRRGGTRGERGGGRRITVVAVAGLTAALFGASVTGGVEGLVRAWPGQPTPPSSAALTREEMRAALWLDEHAAAADVVATNVHCRPIWASGGRTCDARAFWVSGLAGRRMVAESWGYTDSALARHSRDGLVYYRQPAPDEERFDLNQRAFSRPTSAGLEQLRQRYGVRWLFADTRAGRVSPELASLARVRLKSGTVTVYELG